MLVRFGLATLEQDTSHHGGKTPPSNGPLRPWPALAKQLPTREPAGMRSM